MQFVQSGFFPMLAALVVPIIIHLLFKRRSRKVELGTIRFLREVLVQNARRRRLKRWMLMALRMVAIGLLVLLFARPFFPEPTSGKSGRIVVVLADRSATMQLQVDGQRLVDLAADQANAVIRQTNDSTIHVAWFDHAVEPVVGESGLPVLVPPDAASGGTNYGVALSWARDLLASSEHNEKVLHIFTDLQQSGLDWFDMQPVPSETEVHINDLGQSVVNNLAVVAINAKTLVRPGDPVEVACTISNEAVFAIEEQNVVLKLHQGKRVVTEKKQVKLESGALTAIDFSLDRLQAGLWEGTVELENVVDDLAFDNTRHVAVMVAEQTPVLIVDGRPSEASIVSGSYFLESAVRLAVPGEEFAGSPYAPKVVAFDDASTPLPNLKKWPIVVLADVPKLNTRHIGQLSEYVRNGGNLLVFSGDQVVPDSYSALEVAGVLPGTFTAAETSYDLPWRLDTWDKDHPVMQPFDDPQHGDVRRLAFRGIIPIKPSADSIVVASFRGGQPALVERSCGKGRTLLFASSCDRQWTDWPRSRLYVPMLHQMLGYLTGLAEGGPIRQTMIENVAETESGIYQRDRYWDVVNPGPRESEVDRTTVSDFANRFGLQVAENEETSSIRTTESAGVEIRESEIWPVFLLALIAILGLESLLANRTLA